MAELKTRNVRATDIELKDKLVAINRVTKVTKGGRHFSFSAIVVVGDENGVVGHGLGKAKEVTEAIAKAIDDAKKNLIKVPIINDTLPHAIRSRFGGGNVFMKPASAGTGIIAGGPVRAVCEVLGVKDIVAKSMGTSNAHNVIRATMKALLKQNSPKQISAIRNKKISEIVGKRG